MTTSSLKDFDVLFNFKPDLDDRVRFNTQTAEQLPGQAQDTVSSTY